MITVSAGEFAATVTKACLGARVQRGIALELGSACMELSLLGHRPIPTLVERIAASSSKAKSGGWTKGDDGWTIPTAVSLPDAVSMIDFAAMAETGSRAAITYTPNLVLGLALNRMRCHDLMLEVSVDGRNWTSVVEVTAHLSDELLPCSMALRQARGELGLGLPNIIAIDVSDDDWNSLAPWVARTLVKADETNRADAGAGNTDND
ncbi:MAG: hypothetical protein ACR2PF_17215 [Rhizobiaceae bacterium]